MRILKIELSAALHSTNPDVSLASEELRAQLFREMEGLRYELGERIRQRASTYFPPEYSIFVRLYFAPENTFVVTHIWVDDPTVRWPAGLFARRAWKLSIPILSHVVKDTFQSRVQSVEMRFSEKDARIVSFAPRRGWLDPVILTVLVALLTSAYWLFLQIPIRNLLRGLTGW